MTEHRALAYKNAIWVANRVRQMAAEGITDPVAYDCLAETLVRHIGWLRDAERSAERPRSTKADRDAARALWP